jgi:hypothetical protein
MASGFIAVVPTGCLADRPALLAAGATSVLSWVELATSDEPDDVPTVLIDGSTLEAVAEVAAVLGTLTAVDPPAGPVGGSGGSVRADQDVVIATVRPVVDTLKLVDAEGVLTGTAERDDHRFVGTPIAARLRVLRAVSRELQDGSAPVAVLAALVRRGATVLGSTH